MNAYLDTSVLVSLYVPESRTQKLLDLISGIKGALIISRLVETEFYATLSKKKRTKELSAVQIKNVIKVFEDHIKDGAYSLQPINDIVFETANNILREMKTNLRTLDALHLAAAKCGRCELMTADKALAESAAKAKVPVRLL